MNKFNNAKHAKSNLFLFPFIAIIIAALVALPFIAQALSQKAQAEPMSPADCEQASIRTNDVEAELMDCYEAFGHAYNNEYNFVMISEIIGGECLVSGDYYDSPARVLDTFDKNSTTHNTDILNNTWVNYYAAIDKINAFIDKYDKGSQTSSANVQLLAEAYTLRGICYFDLARLFENVPLVTKPNGPKAGQASVDDLYSQILSDFDYGAINGNNFIKDSEEKNKTNRISKYASMAMIGRAYLFYKDYYNRGEQIDMRYPSIKTYLSKEDVTAYLKDLVSNSGLRLTEQFPNSFASSVAMCRSIYVQAEPGDIATLLGDEEHDPGFGFFDKSEYIFSINYNCETLSESDNWTSKLGIYNSQQLLRDSGSGMISVSPSVDAEVRIHEVIDPYAPSPDFRFGIPGMSKVPLDGEAYQMTMYSQSTWDKYLSEWNNCTGHIISKYAPVCYSDGTSVNVNQPLVLIRYADVLLMLSELTGDPSYLNQVQARAGVAQYSYTVDNLRYERQTELMFEGINYWDDLRWGRAGQKFNDLQVPISVCMNGVWQLTSGYDIANYNSKHFLPIPESQIAKYGYRQNPGW